MEVPDLGGIATADLLQEVSNRFHGAVFIGDPIGGEVNGVQMDLFLFQSCASPYAIGLCKVASQRILDRYGGLEGDDEEDDE